MSTLKVDTIDTSNSSGNITVSRPLSGSGASLTALNATNLASGTVATARLGSGTADNTVFLRGDGTWVAAGSTSASDLTSGTLPIARIADDAITNAKMADDAIDSAQIADGAVDNVHLASGIDAAKVTTGTLPMARLSGTLPALNGSALTNLPSHTGNVTFPASQSASSDANILDDYEEGTFTPTIQDNSKSDSEGQQYHGNRSGVYTKVGRLVTCNGYMNINNSGTMTSSDPARIAGFPFTSRNNGTEQAVVSMSNLGGFDNNTVRNVTAALEGNETTAAIMSTNTQSGANTFTINTLQGGYFSFSVTYFV